MIPYMSCPERRTIAAAKFRSQGFSLVEMAIVLLIVGLLLGGLLPTVSSQYEQQHRNDTRKQLEEIQQALIGFAVINGRLPCPASSATNGMEDSPVVGIGACSHPYDGFVPATALGLSATDSQGFAVDSWGNRIRYAVTAWSSMTPAVTGVFTTAGGMSMVGISNLSPNLLVCSTAAGITGSPPTCASGTALTSSPGVPAVIFSIGRNGGGGASPDETANLNGDRAFVSRDFVQDGFDDMVIWISPNILINRMVGAGKLP